MKGHTNMERLDRLARKLSAFGFSLLQIRDSLAYVEFADGSRPEMWQVEEALSAVTLDKVAKWEARQRSRSYV